MQPVSPLWLPPQPGGGSSNPRFPELPPFPEQPERVWTGLATLRIRWGWPGCQLAVLGGDQALAGQGVSQVSLQSLEPRSSPGHPQGTLAIAALWLQF